MKVIKKILSSILTLVMVGSMCFVNSFAAYDHGAAQRYADKYVNSSNSTFRYWADNDCTNFVSQCLLAGGLEETDDWYYKNYLSQSLTWINANELKGHLKSNLKATLLGRWKKNACTNSYGTKYYAYTNNSNNIKGYGSEIVFYDWTDDGTMNHASIVVGTNNPINDPNGSSVGDLIDAHTKPGKWQYWHLDGHNAKYRETTAVYVYRLPDNV